MCSNHQVDLVTRRSKSKVEHIFVPALVQHPVENGNAAFQRKENICVVIFNLLLEMEFVFSKHFDQYFWYIFLSV